MKMQIAFRETDTVRHNHLAAIAGGLIEIGPEDATDYEDKSLVFRFDFNPFLDHPVAVSSLWHPRKLVGEYGNLENELEVGTLEGLITAHFHRAVPDNNHNADFVLRQTEVPPSVEGGRVFAFSGFLHLKPGQKMNFRNLLWFESAAPLNENMMLYAGRSGIERRPEHGVLDMVENMRGEAMGELLHKPLWGFGEEPYSLPGTMKLSMYHKMDRYRRLFCSETLTDAQSQELDGLKKEMLYAGLNTIEKDDMFRAFSKEMVEKYPDLSSYKPLTRGEVEDRDQKVREVMERILHDDPSNMRYGR